MTGRTPEGRKAYTLLSWAGENAARVPVARRRVDSLALDLMSRRQGGGPDAALSEVQDVGRMLARMGAQPVGLTGIGGQLVELADWDPLKHPRGEHGKFVSAAAHATAHATASAHAREEIAARKAGERTAPDPDKIIAGIKDRAAAAARGGAAPDPAKAAVERDAMAQVRAMQDRMEKMEKELASLRKEQGKESKEQDELIRDKRVDFSASIISTLAGIGIAFFTGDASLAPALLGAFLVKTMAEKGPDLLIARGKLKLQELEEKHAWARKTLDFLEHPGHQTVRGTAVAARSSVKASAAVTRKAATTAKAAAARTQLTSLRQALTRSP